MKYLVGEKFMNYLDAAERDAEFRAELPAFVAEIKKIFEPWQIAEYLEKAGWTEPFDPSLYDEDDGLRPRRDRDGTQGQHPACRQRDRFD